MRVQGVKEGFEEFLDGGSVCDFDLGERMCVIVTEDLGLVGMGLGGHCPFNQDKVVQECIIQSSIRLFVTAFKRLGYRAKLDLGRNYQWAFPGGYDYIVKHSRKNTALPVKC